MGTPGAGDKAVFGLSRARQCAAHGPREECGAGSGVADGCDTPLRVADWRREGARGPSEMSGSGRSTMVTEGVQCPVWGHNEQDTVGPGLWRWSRQLRKPTSAAACGRNLPEAERELRVSRLHWRGMNRLISQWLREHAAE
ncbi:hypothetical protein NDU88_004037 [Pleurodeles waltl]|uniref:Uncharacterized protein n=1 Tax=Pleurodeles waltl TaxID=8319 RepID=A0AAV7NIC7_PLEWA|nr:hypothetical protein NDU88_004037 [Pleurodeles waltl]